MRVEIKEKSMFQLFMSQMYPEYKSIQVDGICIDSRVVQINDMFIALKGDHADGHHFISQAVDSGASIIISEQEIDIQIPIIKVHSTRGFLVSFASVWWDQFSVPVIGITGSNGKTTTKEMLVHVLQSTLSVAWMPGNYNSTIGLPLSLFAMSASSDIAIFEMGTSSPGEIKALVDMTKPEMGLITNIHPAHIEFFSDLEHIANEKAVLLESLPSSGTAFINLDDPSICSIETTAHQITFGTIDSADFVGNWQFSSDKSEFTINGNKVAIPQYSETMARNTLAVYAVCKTLGLDHDTISQRLSSFSIPDGRGNILIKNEITVINDTYNANPESVKAGIRFALSNSPDKRHIIIIGDMFELGAVSMEYHSDLGDFISHFDDIIVLTIGH
ncbi:MAG: UDP-N-acetylmuramoyl-tripeptide--D-alanyl-D-alanine ligase, partial [Fidelibacterota bacterium]